MSLPRQILPDKCWFLSRSCVMQMFLLRPDDITNATYAYCLAEAAQRFKIPIVLPLAMTNHEHIVLDDPDCNQSAFMAHFHKMVAKAVNAHLGRRENLWSVEPPCMVELGDTQALIDKLIYTATNPVTAGLVSKAEDWPGFSGVQAFLDDKPIVTHRPKHFFDQHGDMPETVIHKLAIPRRYGDPRWIRERVREGIKKVEAECAEKRRRAKKRVLGAAGVRAQDWRSCPNSRRQRGGIRPRFASKWLWRRFELTDRHKKFQKAYREAYRAWRAGEPAVFPAGTYWLARFANVTVASVEKI